MISGTAVLLFSCVQGMHSLLSYLPVYYTPFHNKSHAPTGAPPSMKIGVRSYFQRIRDGIHVSWWE